MVRRLLRLERQWQHFQTHPSTALHHSIHRRAHALRHHMQFPWESWDAVGYGPALTVGIKKKVEEEERRARIAQWQERMAHDFAATMRWVQRHYEREEGAADMDPSLASEAVRFHAELAPVWQPASLDAWNGAHLEGLDEWFKANRTELQLLVVEAADLREAIRKKRGKASGPDAWNAEHLVEAPDIFYQ